MADELEGAPAPVTPVETPDDTPVPSPTPRANVPPKNASEAFDAIAAEAKTELDERAREDEAIDAAAKKAAADVTASDEDVDSDESADDDEDKPAAKDDDAEDEDADEDKPAAVEADAEEVPEKTVAEQILELMRDPETLEAALRQAGPDAIKDLQLIKDLVGRERQSVADQTKSELARQEWEAKNIEGVMVEGRKAQTDLIDLMEKLTADLSNEVEDLDVPSKQLIEDAFETFGKGAMQAYHNAHFGQITDKVYQYPEYQSLSPEQKDTLSKMDGASPADWVEAHLEIGRENLWRMAQEDVNVQAKQFVDDQTKILTEAHKVEVEKLTAKFDKKLAQAITKTAEETRAAALADFAQKGSPPRVVQKNASPNVDDESIDYSSFESIAESVKKSLARGGDGV